MFKSLILLLLTFFSISSSAQRPIHKELLKKRGYAYVEAGSFSLTSCDDGIYVEQIPEFYISATEISNGQYREFLQASKAQTDTTEWNTWQPKVEEWKQLMFCEPMRIFYWTHPAYDDYPVVNISPEGAKAYCAWYAAELSALYPDYDIECRLPSKEEWMKAAASEPVWDAPYPFGPFLRNSKGNYLHNYKAKDSVDVPVKALKETGAPAGKQKQEITVYMNDGGLYMTQAKSYFPNGNGLYNTSGNVAEMLNDGTLAGGDWNSFAYDIRICSFKPYEKPSPTAGFRPVLSLRPKQVDVQ